MTSSPAARTTPRSAAVLAVALLSACSKPAPQPDAPVKVAAAAPISRSRSRRSAPRSRRRAASTSTSRFGSTGLLAKQITEGAPFDVFAAANVSFVDDVVARARASATTKALYARGRIVALVEAAPGAAEGHRRAERSEVREDRDRQPRARAVRQAPRSEAMTKAGVWERGAAAHGLRRERPADAQFARSGQRRRRDRRALARGRRRPGNYMPIDEPPRAARSGARRLQRRRAASGGRQGVRAVRQLGGRREVMKRYGLLAARRGGGEDAVAGPHRGADSDASFR